METKFVKILFDLHCDWEGIAPDYRVYVNDELFTERTYRWEDPEYLTEMLQVQAKPGKYRFRLEKIGPQICKFNILDTRVAYGDAKIIDKHTFEILDEDYENK
jgi:hypothetical protein